MQDQSPGFRPDDEIEITENDVPGNGDEVSSSQSEQAQICGQCQVQVPAGTGVATENEVFCEPCFQQLTELLETSLAEQGKGINYLGGVVGGLIGGMLGAGVWWGFTTLTNIQFGLVAVLIGWGAGKGVVLMSGSKRAVPLQFISLAITLVSYGLANYWVTRTFLIRYVTENGLEGGLPFFPSAVLFKQVIFAGFEMWDLIFLAIALWQAWKIPAPMVLQKAD